MGQRKAVACAALRTRATGQPASMRPSATGPAVALMPIAASGGSSDTCATAVAAVTCDCQHRRCCIAVSRIALISLQVSLLLHHISLVMQ